MTYGATSIVEEVLPDQYAPPNELMLLKPDMLLVATSTFGGVALYGKSTVEPRLYSHRVDMNNTSLKAFLLDLAERDLGVEEAWRETSWVFRSTE